MKIIIHVALLSLFIPALSYAENEHLHKESTHVSGVEALSPGLRDLLNKEMQALQSGMMSIIPAYISGNWSEIADTAGKIQRSYILKQNLTDNQAEELHSLLPDAFIEKDLRFHYLAGMLEHVAKNENAELINFYFSKMNESCVECHSRYASHKFPALSPKPKTGEHTHQ